jgi:hypothetical protein
LNVSIDPEKKDRTLMGQVDTFPNYLQRLKQGQYTLTEVARHTIPTKLIEVAENAKRSAMGDAINPYA